MSTQQSTTTGDHFSARWAVWHESRERAVRAPYGPAALVATNWLADGVELELDGVAGTWSIVDGAVVGSGLAESGYVDASGSGVGDRVTLKTGEELRDGARILRAFARDDQRALRVLDPEASGRAALLGIDSYQPDDDYVVSASFRPSTEQVDVLQADGYVSRKDLGGKLDFELGGSAFSIDADHTEAGLQVVFADTTSGVESYRFRFLTVPAPEADGATTIDFNRAYLPPCAFSDHFVCPTPAADNRLSVPVRAGERNAIKA
ncbi:hypothetical protein C5E07_08355 [Pseudoclavibacter sp. RFBJ3]|uniref:DUF1684 domain-containing protein n=1 Tax=unclassified Pseudoclavibacter TaxID=2615177 RepID=UPI000CE7B443|nr:MULTISPECIES: DUF1684 domain-containing protein [unclassified Pseudoclavibacter]PPF84298.1 hypothetical protein C5C12_07610 [Pseudoclavibacter sp. RFBJ5]PPF92802.1 hypothetical protein C5E07_08355 [Pseudoclavibacter sp. RFBJ3]PPF98126.1 hypothetical protein C5C19_09885 [Pseudoclavibacter sp. RFBH5]PPG25196.1 hypothetical protein C5E13_03915 [Pseudoclavibacter sp. RFBI4]